MKRLHKFFSHFFTPTDKNNFKAKALHIDFLAYYLIFAFLLVITAKHSGTYFKNVLGYATDITVPKLLELTNKEREKQQLSPLQYNEQLSQAAAHKAQDMFSKNYWSHFAPNGTTPWEFISQSHYQYEYAGENLAKNFLFSQGVVDAWMNSPTHRENVLRKEYKDVGFAILNGVLNGEETTLVVQMLGTPIGETVQTETQKLVQQQVPVVEEKAPVVIGKDMPKVLGKENTTPKINLFYFSFNITLLFIFAFSFILILDFYIATKMHIIRINGKNIAHLIFLAFILISVMFILKKGVIL